MILKWSHGEEVFTAGISPGMGKHCNIGHLVDPQFRKEFGDDLPNIPDNETILSLDVEACQRRRQIASLGRSKPAFPG
jgi:hypothetical protein